MTEENKSIIDKGGDHMNFKKEVKKRMIDIDTSDVQVAKLLGRSRGTLARWLRDPQNVKLNDLVLLLRALKYSEEEAAGMVKKIQSEAWG